MTRTCRTAAVTALVLAAAAPPAAAIAERDAGLERGIREVEAGEYLVATDTLQGAVRRLYGTPDEDALAQAYLYLGIAWARLDRSDRASANLAEALAIDWGLKVPEGMEDARLASALELARREVEKSGRAPASAAKKSGVGVIVVAGGAALVAGGIALQQGLSKDAPPRFAIETRIVHQEAETGACGGTFSGALGTIFREPDQLTYEQGETVRFTFEPGELFVTWTRGCAPSFGPSCALQVEDRTVVEACAILRYPQ